MPHIIAHSYHNNAHPLFKKKGKVRENSPTPTSNEINTKEKVPRTYESIKEAAGAKEQVHLTKKK